MIFKNVLLVVSLLLTNGLFAQRISGKVAETDGKAADFATVALLAAKDSSLVTGTLTGDDGTFDLKSPDAGTYLIKVSMVGAPDFFTAPIELTGGSQTLAPIVLPEQSTELKEVTVVSRRPPVEVKADKTVLNVEGTVNSTGLSALELLRKAPGVTVDNNENVNVKGKNNVRIQIDGRDTPLDGKDLSALLKNMQAADIANIEIISNPSAKYDAAGNAGIINIKLKKNKSLGTNGNVSVDAIYGKTPKGGMNLSLNNRSKKFNVFGTYNNHYGRWHNDQNFIREQAGMVFDQKAESYNTSRWNSVRTGFDWYANDRHTFGVLVNGSHDGGSWHNDSRSTISTFANRDRVDSLLVATNDVTGTRVNLNSNINYRFADTSGHTLNVDFDYGVFRITSESYQPNYYRLPNESAELSRRVFSNSTPTNIDIFTGKLDWEQRLWKGTLGAGAKIAIVNTDNTFDFFNEIGGRPVFDTSVSNQFLYEERTTAAYVNYNRAFGKKLNVQAGLRVENTHYMGDLISYNSQNGQRIADDYTELFPSAAVTYSFTDKIGLNATYSRRIDRPSYQDLNPFEFKLDELTFQRGNPRLRPQFTNSFEISPTYTGYPVVTLGYSKTKDVFTQVLATDARNPNATFITNENLANQTNLSASLNIPTPFAKWYEGFISITVLNSRFDANFANLGFDIDEVKFTTGNLYAEQTVKLGKGWSVQLSGWYNTAGYWGTLRSRPQGVMDFGVQKKLFADKGQLRLRFGDLLGTARWGGDNVFTPGLKMYANGGWEARTITATFSYRFGSQEVKSARQRKTGLEDEKNRVKSGRG
jgi:iron complex outermembrane recepter protein